MRPAPWLAWLVLASACGDGGGDRAPGDASADAGPDAAAAIVAPPEPPSLGPCPAGWRTIAGDPDTCEPWPEGGRHPCGIGEAHFVGGDGCAPVGDRCPAGDYAEDLPAGGDVRYVRAGAPAGGDGSFESPFATISEAMAVAGDGTTIALATGTYDEPVVLRAGVTLLGACAAGTHIRTSSPSLVRQGVVTASGARTSIRNVTVGGAREGIVVSSDAGLEVRGVVVDGALASGVSVFPGGRLTGSELVVLDTTPAERTWGYGIAVAPEGAVDLARVSIERSTSSALAVLGAEVILADVLLLDPQPQMADGRLGTAVEASGGASVTLRRAAVEGAHDRALMVSEPGTRLVLEDAVVRGTRPRASDDGGGNAAFAFDGAVLALSRVLLVDHREAAILASDVDTRVELTDVVVWGTRGRASDSGGGSAVALQAGVAATITRAQLEDNRGITLFVSGASTVTLTDVTVRATGSEETDQRFATGLQAQDGSAVEGERVLVADNRGSGVTAIGAGSRLRLLDARIAGTLERECAASTCPGLGFGDGAIAAADGAIELERFVVEGCARAGVHVGGGTMDLRHGRIVRNPIGAAIQTPGFDVARISEDVLFLENDRNVDTTTLPLPEPSVDY